MNATIGVEPHGSEARTMAVDPQVLGRYLAWLELQTPQRRIIGMAAEYASLAGNRKVEFLQLSWDQIDETAGVVQTVRANQRGKRRGEVSELVTITPSMQALIDQLKALRAERGVDCAHVFPTRDNNAYTARGFKTLWQRCVLQVIKENVLSKEDRFTFHDLRAYYATAHKKALGTPITPALAADGALAAAQGAGDGTQTLLLLQPQGYCMTIALAQLLIIFLCHLGLNSRCCTSKLRPPVLIEPSAHGPVAASIKAHPWQPHREFLHHDMTRHSVLQAPAAVTQPDLNRLMHFIQPELSTFELATPLHQPRLGAVADQAVEGCLHTLVDAMGAAEHHPPPQWCPRVVLAPIDSTKARRDATPA